MLQIGIKEQLSKIKDNWLLIAIVVIILIVMSGIFSGTSFTKSMQMQSSLAERGAPSAYSKAAYDSSAGGYYPTPTESFAPEETVRKITKTSSMSTEVERGTFYDSEKRLLDIVKSSDSFLLNQNVNKYGTDRESYVTGSYQVKVDVKKYDSVVSQLRGIGEVQSFNENAEDVTGQYTDTKIEIETEKARLKRYETMYSEATDVEDKITLTDRMFNLERSIKYLEDSLENIDQRVDYSTVYVTMTEKTSDYYGITFVTLSEMITLVAGSANTLVKFLITILPWALAFFIIRFVVRLVRKK